MPDNKVDIYELFDETSEAYSFDRYGEDDWLKAIESMGELGLDAEQITWILFSKHMRWHADHQEENNDAEMGLDVLGPSIGEYISSDTNGVLIDLKNDLDRDVVLSMKDGEFNSTSMSL